jgi:hypothetical protein
VSDFIPCTLRQLPEPRLIDAARTACRVNPANRPLAAGGAALEPQRLALLTSKYWGAGGVKLGVAFLDDAPADLRDRILGHMNAWGGRANVTFTPASRAGAQVRVLRERGGGYWSYLGTDVLHIPSGEPTMNLDSFGMDTPEGEYLRVVRHETGHTLGFPHEHLRREIVQRLDPQKTIAWFGRTYGWSADEVRQQVLTPLEEALLVATPHADLASIMCYQLSGECTTDGRPVPGGADIDEADFGLAEKVYPRPGGPPPPPPPPPGPASLFDLTFERDVRKGAHVSFNAPVKVPAGRYGVIRLASVPAAPALAGERHDADAGVPDSPDAP